MINDDNKVKPQQTNQQASLATDSTSHLEQIASHSGENKLPAPDLSATDKCIETATSTPQKTCFPLFNGNFKAIFSSPVR